MLFQGKCINIKYKKVFFKFPKYLRRFQAQCPSICKPPQPIHTHWETWLQEAFYNILQLVAVKAAAVNESQSIFQDTSLEIDLQSINLYLL